MNPVEFTPEFTQEVNLTKLGSDLRGLRNMLDVSKKEAKSAIGAAQELKLTDIENEILEAVEHIEKIQEILAHPRVEEYTGPEYIVPF